MKHGPLFLSASVPTSGREPFFSSSDPTAIATAVSSLVFVALGRRAIVWGGHPAITPIVWTVANDLAIDYGKWVHLYQSRIFKEDFPEENRRFQNVTYVDAVDDDKDASLLEMRRRMIGDFKFEAGVFIGGMEGVVAEFELFRAMHANAPAYPIPSTGGAALALQQRFGCLPNTLANSIDYIGLFHSVLEISPQEKRASTASSDRSLRPRSVPSLGSSRDVGANVLEFLRKLFPRR